MFDMDKLGRGWWRERQGAAEAGHGRRMGYESISSMIRHSATWTSSVDLSPTSRIFCVGIADLKLIRDIRVDRDLKPLGILFDYRHIVTGKGLSTQQTSALLRRVEVVSQQFG